MILHQKKIILQPIHQNELNSILLVIYVMPTAQPPKDMYRRPHNRRLKHFSLVWQSLCLDNYMKILRGPFQEQLGNLSMKIKRCR